jgi:cysteine desulfurase
MSKALEISLNSMKENYILMKQCQKQIIDRLSEIEGIIVNTDINSSIPGIVNFSALNYNPEVLIRALSNKSIYVSSRSVCSVEKKDQVSSTLYAMKKDISICISSIRTSFVKALTQEEIDYFISSIKEALNDVRK